MEKYLNIFKSEKKLMIAVIGAVTFSFILVLTLNFSLAIFALVLFSIFIIFQKSFHYGLVFLLSIILLFPPLNLIEEVIDTREFFVLLLAMISGVSLLLKGFKFKILKLFYYWIGLMILSMISFVFLDNNAEGFYGNNYIGLAKFIGISITFLIIIISFQYFFQTTRRLERFFLTVVLMGTICASIRVILFSGFFDFIYSGYLNESSWTYLMVITIPITFGMWLLQKKSLSTLKFLEPQKIKQKGDKHIDIVIKKNNNLQKEIVNLRQSKSKIQVFLVMALIIQIFSLIISFSFLQLVAIGIGLFIIGVLMREKKVIWLALILSLGVAIFLPKFNPGLIIQFREDILNLIVIIKNSQSLSILWQGAIIDKYQFTGSSYLLIFDKLGLLGLLIFLLGLGQYFREIRNAYLKSDDFERIWLVVLLAIFIEFVLLGFLTNVLFAGPAVLLFWVFYGVLQSLKKHKKEYSLIETRL